jgi:hypothetical protein
MIAISRLAIAAILLLGTLTSATSFTEVIHLTDYTFEHDTQASTGQTTGVWAVLVSAPSLGRRHADAMSLWTNLAENEDKGEIFAYVNMDENRGVAARFIHALPSVPAMVLLKGRGVYYYPLPDEDAEDMILGVINGGYSQLTKQVVPPEVHPSQINAILTKKGSSEAQKAANETLWTAENVQRMYIAAFFFLISMVWKGAIYFVKRADNSAQEVEETQVTELVQEKAAPKGENGKSGAKKGQSTVSKDNKQKPVVGEKKKK